MDIFETPTLVPSPFGNGNVQARFLEGAAVVTLKWGTRLNQRKTDQEGRAVYDRALYAHVRNPGQTDSVTHEVKFRDLEKLEVDPNSQIFKRFPNQIKAFLSNELVPAEGTPLEMWPVLSPDQVANLHVLGIRTVEELASLKNNDAGAKAAGRELVAKAVAFVDVNKDAAAAQKYAAENETLKLEVSRLTDVVAELKAGLDRLTNEKEKKGRG